MANVTNTPVQGHSIGCFDPGPHRNQAIALVTVIALAALALFGYAIVSHFVPYLLGHLAMTPHVTFASMALSALALTTLLGVVSSCHRPSHSNDAQQTSHLLDTLHRLPEVRGTLEHILGTDTLEARVQAIYGNTPPTLNFHEDISSETVSFCYTIILATDEQLGQMRLDSIFNASDEEENYERWYCLHVRLALAEKPLHFPQDPQNKTTTLTETSTLNDLWSCSGHDLLLAGRADNESLAAVFFPFISSTQLIQAFTEYDLTNLGSLILPIEERLEAELTHLYNRLKCCPPSLMMKDNINIFLELYFTCLETLSPDGLHEESIAFLRSLFPIATAHESNAVEMNQHIADMLNSLTDENLRAIAPYLEKDRLALLLNDRRAILPNK